VSRKKSKLSVNLILNTFFRHTLVKRFIVVVKDLEIVLTSTNVTSICSNSNLRLDLASTNNNAFDDD
jgi:hypothetical protein